MHEFSKNKSNSSDLISEIHFLSSLSFKVQQRKKKRKEKNVNVKIFLQPTLKLKSATFKHVVRARTQKTKRRALGHSHISAQILWITACHANTRETISRRTNSQSDKALPSVAGGFCECKAAQ